jgi:predicted DNA-binding transcriptional regulator YafY
MGYGENVVVEQPNNLRDEVAERLRKAVKAYK